MRKNEIKYLVQKYFEGDTSLEEEQLLNDYFQAEKVDEDLLEFKPFFSGLNEMKKNQESDNTTAEIMDYILAKENTEKSKYRRMWLSVTGIAASVIIILGGILVYENSRSQFKDSFTDPDEAYVYAEQTLLYVAEKYNKGISQLPQIKNYSNSIAQLSKFNKLEQASNLLVNGVKTINKGFNEIGNLQY